MAACRRARFRVEGDFDMTDAVAGQAPRRSAPFAPYHKWDRNFFLTYVVLIWIGIVMGFGDDIVHHIQSHEIAYPLIVHFHAVAFVGWLVVLTAQVLLIRRGQPQIHARLGVAAMVLALVMIVIGPATALYMQRLQWGTPDSDPAFLAVQLSDIVAFTTLVGAAFAWRGTPSAHKRLILLATLYISDAGFARWLAGDVHAVLGGGYWPFLAGLYFANDTLILGLGAYDLVTRRRLHPAYLVAVPWIAAIQLTVGYLYAAPFWKEAATHLIGH